MKVSWVDSLQGSIFDCLQCFPPTFARVVKGCRRYEIYGFHSPLSLGNISLAGPWNTAVGATLPRHFHGDVGCIEGRFPTANRPTLGSMKYPENGGDVAEPNSVVTCCLFFSLAGVQGGAGRRRKQQAIVSCRS